MMDVAQVAATIWTKVFSRKWTDEAAIRWNLSAENMAGWMSFLAGLHDLGKATPAFQSKDEVARAELSRSGFDFPPQPRSTYHGTLSAALIPRVLRRYGIQSSLGDTLARILGGHHGDFPSSLELIELGHHVTGGPQWERTRETLTTTLLHAVLRYSVDVPQPEDEVDNGFLMFLAGFVSVSDWIGSIEDFFPYSEGECSVEDYTALSRTRAMEALTYLGWYTWQPDEKVYPFETLFPACWPPRPSQKAVLKIFETDSKPRMILLEAPMGEGKTEAALYCVERWVHENGQKGAYVALPTMATSNQMFERVKSFLDTRYAGQRVGFQLLHSHALLSDSFQSIRLKGIGQDEPGNCKAPSTVLATDWFVQRKRGLLAPFAVGTIDQALLAVLQTRHFFVRLFGLAQKTVILDEVHAFDMYMSTLLDRLLEWLAALNCTVVLLSATLPTRRRAELVSGFAGSGTEAPTEQYPRISWVSTDGSRHCEHIVGSNERTVAIRRLPSEPRSWIPRLREALMEGGCVAVVCNTVGAAQRTYLELRSVFSPGELGLFHARFPFEDRDRLEKQALMQFGPQRLPDVSRPSTFVLVSTQVVEQSLDLDFDLLISQVAPIDLMLQRMGRLHRHQRTRPKRLAAPALWWVSPQEHDRLPDFGPDEYVYERYILLKTWLAIVGLDSLRVPGDIARLVEQVYRELPAPLHLPEALRKDWDKSLEESRRSRVDLESRAKRVRVLPPDYEDDIFENFNRQLEEDDPDTHPTLQALTRLSEPSVSVIALYGNESAAYLDKGRSHPLDLRVRPTLVDEKAFLRKSFAIQHRRALKVILEEGLRPEGWKESSLLRHHRVVFLGEHDQAWLDNGRLSLRLDPDLGVLLEKTNGDVQPH
jgi:CRISPR-associated endonuclease/helicase Cas3